MIAYQTWPPGMSFEFGPKYSTQFNFCRRRIGTLSVRLLQGSFALWRRFFFADWREAFCSFFRWIVLLLICCFAANGWRRLLRFWCFSKIGEESGHVYLFDRFTHVNNFPAFLTPTKCACTVRIQLVPRLQRPVMLRAWGEGWVVIILKLRDVQNAWYLSLLWNTNRFLGIPKWKLQFSYIFLLVDLSNVNIFTFHHTGVMCSS